MRAALLAALALSIALAPAAAGESRGPGGFQAAGGTVWTTWGVAGAQFDEDTAFGVRYWQNATAGGDALVVYATVCLRFDSGAGYCDRMPLHA